MMYLWLQKADALLPSRRGTLQSCKISLQLEDFRTRIKPVPWVPEATRLLNPAGQRPAKRVWGPKWAKRAKGRTRVASGGEPQWSRYVWYRFYTRSLIGYSKTCFFQRPQLVRRGHVKWTGFFSKTECLVEKKCVQRRTSHSFCRPLAGRI